MFMLHLKHVVLIVPASPAISKQSSDAAVLIASSEELKLLLKAP